MKKRILATFLSAVTLVSCGSALAANYSDVNQSAWYSSYVNKISELNAFSGYEDGTFRPDNQITQEEFIKTVVCLICGELNESNAPTVKNTCCISCKSYEEFTPFIKDIYSLLS